MESILIVSNSRQIANMERGDKTLEVRKSAPNSLPVHCFVYRAKGSGKEGAIVGEFLCTKTERFRVAEFDVEGIEKKACFGFFDMLEYFYGNKKDKMRLRQGWAWNIAGFRLYDHPISLGEIGIALPPQSWRYLDESEADRIDILSGGKISNMTFLGAIHDISRSMYQLNNSDIKSPLEVDDYRQKTLLNAASLLCENGYGVSFKWTENHEYESCKVDDGVLTELLIKPSKEGFSIETAKYE